MNGEQSQQSLKVPASPPSLQDQGRIDSMRFGTDMVRMVETILEDLTAEKKIADADLMDLWMPLMKSLKLTFLNETDATILYLQFEESVIDLILSRRRGDFTLKDSLTINQMRMLFRANVKRSVGTSPETMNERILQATSITHSTGTFRESGGGGITGKIAGFFGRGGMK